MWRRWRRRRSSAWPTPGSTAWPAGAARAESACAEAHGNGIRLSIEDRDAGMGEAVRRRAFEPFYTTRMGPHAGLGLTILHGIVTDMLGGEVRLESAPGQGMRLTLELPRMAPE